MMLAVALVFLQGAPDWRGALEAGDFRAAWQAAQDQAGLERARAELCILYKAGDPAGAWSAAQRGLAESPQDLEFLFYATGAALWLGGADAAQLSSARLLAAVAGANLGAQERAAWESTARSYAQAALELERGAATRASALRRSKLVALAGLGLALAGLLYLARQGAAALPQG